MLRRGETFSLRVASTASGLRHRVGCSSLPWQDGLGHAGNSGKSGGEEWVTRVRMSAEESPATTLRVLLVEDDEGDAVLVRELLADAATPVDFGVFPILLTPV